MTKAGGERRRRAKAAALVALAAELDALTKRMKRLPTTDPETFTRADAICIVLRRGVEELKKGHSARHSAPELRRTAHNLRSVHFLEDQ
jgi:glutathione S-transferase